MNQSSEESIDGTITFFEERPNDQFYIRNDEEKNEILELCAWWKGQTIDNLVNLRLEEDQLKGSEVGERIFQTNLYHYAGAGHCIIVSWNRNCRS